MSLATSLKEYRKQHNLTQKEASEKIGIARANLAAIEEGRAYSKLDAIKKILDTVKPEDVKLFLFGQS